MRRTRGKHGAGWLNAGTIWAFVLLVLPACGLQSGGYPLPPEDQPTQNLDQGDQPWSGMIMCHIEKKGGRHCPTSQAEIDQAIPFSDAAIALVEGRSAPFGLDDSETGRNKCPGDPGEIVEFESGTFPQGIAVCLNCSQITSMADALLACQARCYDFHGTTEEGLFLPDIPPTAATKTHCDANTRVATNGVLVNGTTASCHADLCTADGNTTGLDDPRIVAEPVIWTLLNGTQPGGSDGADLERTAPTSEAWDAGAVSQQWITHGNAYVEFSANDNTQAHFVGLTSVNGCASPCSTDSPDDNSIQFAIQLYSDGYYYVVESGAGKFGPGANNSWGYYSGGISLGTRFRIRVLDAGGGKARVLYSRVDGTCLPGNVCNLETFYESEALASYPLRVDTSLKQQGAKLTDVRLVRIQFQ